MMTSRRLSRPALGLAALALVAAPLLGCDTATPPASGTVSGSDSPALALFRDALDRARADYIVPVDREKFVTDALKGALTGLDPHSDYMDESEYREMLSDTEGEFGGLGMEITLDHGAPKIVSPIDDTPAAHAGLRAGDVILKIAGQLTDNMSLKQVVDRLRGHPGTQVALTILRKDEAPFEVTMTRSIIHVVSVKSRLEPNGIGYARITTFSDKTQPELADAIQKMREKAGGHLNGFVLDLRNDPGGLLDAAVDVAGDFFDKGGTVVSTRGRSGEDDHRYTVSSGGDIIPGTPMVVLINGASASASEIVAGALQDSGRATVMGTRSFGKGSVQTIIPLNGRGALRLTTARYYTPSGRSIQDEGINPNIRVALPKSEETANGVVVRESELANALRNTGSLDGKAGGAKGGAALRALESEAAKSDRSGGADIPINPELIGTAKDSQLAAAISYLKQQTAKRRHPSAS